MWGKLAIFDTIGGMPSDLQGFVSRHTRTFFLLILLFSAYFITGKAGLSVQAVHNFATLLWPPTGIALAALILFGRGLWPAVFAGAFAINFSLGASVPIALGIAFGNTLEAVVGAYLLQEVLLLDYSFGRLRDAASLILVALTVPTISATIGVASLLGGAVLSAHDAMQTWNAWWIGDVLGALILTPFFLSWSFLQFKKIQLEETLEFIIICISVVFVNILTFWPSFSHLESTTLLYLVPIPVLWALLRFGPQVTTFIVLLTTLISTFATALGYGPFATDEVVEGLLFSRIFSGALASLALIFSCVVEERRRAMKALQNHVENLQATLVKINSEDEAKNEFLAILAHELRNPLAPIVSSLEILELKSKDEVSPGLIKTMRIHVATMVRLLDDLLDISRISRKKLQLQKEDAVLQTLVKQALQMVEHMFRDKKISVELNLPQEPLHLYVDPVRVEQVVANLLNNAAKYTDQGGKVMVSAQQIKNMVELRVKDTGIGIPKHMLERIFDPFQQIENKRRPTAAGLGIGLSLTKNLLAMHDADITAYSQGQGLGSEFIVHLPIVSTPVPPAGVEEPSMEQTKNKSVLIVDDNKAAAQALSKLLQMHGHEVHVAYSGSEARLQLKEYKPQVILLDIGLPDIEGHSLAKEIRELLGKQCLIIAVSGYGSAHMNGKKNISFDHYFTKPVSFADIEKVLSL